MSDRGRPTKWGGKSARFIEIGGQKVDTIITGHLTQEQINAYQQYFRIEEISHLLRKANTTGKSIVNVLPSYKVENFKRDPSPPPQYDNSGNRTNTREIRIMDLLEKERHALVELAVTSIKNYDPPVDYKKPAKTSEKLYIPIKDYPDINFVGLLLGPRGNTLRQLQEDSGAKLAIRGKGSVKDGKLTDSAANLAPEDNLHVVITADATAKIHKAIKLTNEVIEKAILSPVGQNDLKRDQLRELAVLNGTLRETKPYVPPEMFNAQRRQQTRDITQIVCRICGNVGHYSRDCKLRNEVAASDSSASTTSPAPGAYNNVTLLPQRRPPLVDVPPWKRQRTDETHKFNQQNLVTPPWLTQQSQNQNQHPFSVGHSPYKTYPQHYGPDQRANQRLDPRPQYAYSQNQPYAQGHGQLYTHPQPNHDGHNYNSPYGTPYHLQTSIPPVASALRQLSPSAGTPAGPPPSIGEINPKPSRLPPPPPPPPATVAPPSTLANKPGQKSVKQPPPPPPPPLGVSSGPNGTKGANVPPPPPPKT